jgi:hypothetical protein
MSTLLRVPEELHAQVKHIAAMQGTSAGDLLARAWREFFERHRDEFAAEFEAAADLVRRGDAAGMAAMMKRGNRDRAEAAARRARQRSQETSIA